MKNTAMIDTKQGAHSAAINAFGDAYSSQPYPMKNRVRAVIIDRWTESDDDTIEASARYLSLNFIPGNVTLQAVREMVEEIELEKEETR